VVFTVGVAAIEWLARMPSAHPQASTLRLFVGASTADEQCLEITWRKVATDHDSLKGDRTIQFLVAHR
jgi:hypothetical protein